MGFCWVFKKFVLGGLRVFQSFSRVFRWVFSLFFSGFSGGFQWVSDGFREVCQRF